MERRNSTHPSYSRGSSKPRPLPSNSYANWQQGQDMMRGPSNDSHDSGYHSIHSPQSDDLCFSEQPPVVRLGAMSYVARPSAPLYFDNNLEAPQDYEYSESSAAISRSESNRSQPARNTFSSLRWADTELLRCYKFVVPKGKEPYFELLPTCFVSAQTPPRVYLDSPRPLQKNFFPCMFPGCSDDKNFKRPADLERHYRNVHGPDDQKDQFPCDYPPCKKVRGPFTRKDHFRDHLRDYHKEDLGSMKREKKADKKNLDERKWLSLQDAWVTGRKIVADWWRCPKCLHRVQIAESGYECPECKHTCDRERADRILAVRERVTYAATSTANSTEMEDVQHGYAGAASAAPTYTADCVACGDAGWILNAHGDAWYACQTCQPPVEQHYNVDEDMYADGDNYISSIGSSRYH